MAPRRDVHHPAWRTLPAVACGGRAWRRTGHPGAKAARQGRRQTLLQACAAPEPGAAQDRHRSVAQLSGGKSRDPRTCEREARVRQSCSPTEQPRREQPPTDARTRASHPPGGLPSGRAWFSQPRTHASVLVELRTDIRQHFALKRRLLRASLYRKQLAARFVAWREFAELAQNPSTVF